MNSKTNKAVDTAKTNPQRLTIDRATIKRIMHPVYYTACKSWTVENHFHDNMDMELLGDIACGLCECIMGQKKLGIPIETRVYHLQVPYYINGRFVDMRGSMDLEVHPETKKAYILGFQVWERGPRSFTVYWRNERLAPTA